jgi:hypothetical protein
MGRLFFVERKENCGARLRMLRGCCLKRRAQRAIQIRHASPAEPAMHLSSRSADFSKAFFKELPCYGAALFD